MFVFLSACGLSVYVCRHCIHTTVGVANLESPFSGGVVVFQPRSFLRPNQKDENVARRVPRIAFN